VGILILMHNPTEGPGTLGYYLEARGVPIRLVHLYRGQTLPGSLDDVEGVVSMGGPMNVYQDGAHPFLREEASFLERAIAAGIPVLGICLGAQMIARVRGARVGKSPVGEVGWHPVSLTPAGCRDPLFRDLPPRFHVFQWHEDMFDVPVGGELLATGEGCPHQAFRTGSAVGLQFHLEVNRQMLAHWFADSPRKGEILSEYARRGEELDGVAERLYGRFLEAVKEGAGAVP
jgi:GMP synthase-like glutamine amidotransferase